LNKKKVKVTLVGGCGRMGRAITQVLSTSEHSELYASVVSSDSIFLGLDAGLHSGTRENNVKITSDLEQSIKNCDVVIDFSASANLQNVISLCQKYSRSLVIGVTGLSAEQKEFIRSASEKTGIVFSPNMSIGVNLLFKLTEIAAGVIGERFNIEILDIHHKHKKDSPSGTAERLKEILLAELGRKEEDVIYGRHGNYESRPEKEIAIHSMRSGEVVGDHTVYFFSPEERIEISHKAQDRKTFAVGAVRAGEFVATKKSGLFDMFDVLGI